MKCSDFYITFGCNINAIAVNENIVSSNIPIISSVSRNMFCNPYGICANVQSGE